jgi:hydroxymethylpyrimidine/phosphomethylpyrimidine kinase
LLEARAEELYRSVLLPLAVVATPNVREAEVLLGQDIETLQHQHEAARALGELGCRTVVVKGGDVVSGAQGEAVDVVWDGTSTYELRTRRVQTRNNHGSGCTFASAVAAGLAQGWGVRDSLAAAKAYVTSALTAATHWQLGAGNGPLDHFARQRRDRSPTRPATEPEGQSS